MTASQLTAMDIINASTHYGWTMEVRGNILTIHKNIMPNDKESFVTADMEYGSILGILKRTSAGSDWGTDGGGIGALNAMKTGRFTMNRSGGSKLVLKALSKMI